MIIFVAEINFTRTLPIKGFMKKQILEALKTKFEGIQEPVLNRIADKLAKTVLKEEDVATAIEGVTIQTVIDSYADSRVSEATQSAVTNYEKKHNIKDGKQVTAEPEKKPEAKKDDAPEWAQALIKSNETLAAKLAAIEGEKVVTTRKQLLDAAIEKAPDQFKARYAKDFNRMNFKDEEEFGAWIDEVKTDAETFATELAAAGTVFSRPRGGAAGKPDEKPSPEVQARIDARTAETAAPAIIGLPTK